jgi:hypothetical protein
MAGATGTAWPPRVSALGRALADGLIAADDARVDLVQLVLPAMAEMDRMHVSMLELLVNWIPVDTVGAPDSKRPWNEARVVDASYPWTAGSRIWSAAQIGRARPRLLPALTSVIGTLERHGFADQHDHTPNLLARYSEQIRQDSERHGPRPGQRITTMTMLPATMSELAAQRLAHPPSWSPTELGEQVLGYYQFAAAEPGADPPQEADRS